MRFYKIFDSKWITKKKQKSRRKVGRASYVESNEKVKQLKNMENNSKYHAITKY